MPSPSRAPVPPDETSRLRHPLNALAEFLHKESAGGIVLVAAVVVALAWSNSPFDAGYRDVVAGPGRVDLHAVVNEGLMTIFFLVVGLEIKRELVLGELRDRSSADSIAQ